MSETTISFLMGVSGLVLSVFGLLVGILSHGWIIDYCERHPEKFIARLMRLLTKGLIQRRTLRRPGILSISDISNAVIEKNDPGINSISIDLVRDTLRSYDFIFGPAIEEYCKLNDMKIEDLVALICSEFNRHILLVRYDYEQISIPLQKKMFVSLTKHGETVEIVECTRARDMSRSWYVWQEACDAYFDAVNLSYRRTTNLGTAQLSFSPKRIERAIEKLIDAVDLCIKEGRAQGDKYRFMRNSEYVDRMRDVWARANNSLLAFEASRDGKAFTNAIIDLEIIISLAHKVVLM